MEGGGKEMKEEEVLRLLLQSPEAADAFSSWMKLQWAEFIVVGGLLAILVLGSVLFVFWMAKNS
jgi:hypothetical protein